MRVVVVGGGGREQAIAWACRRHGHDVVARRRRSTPLDLDGARPRDPRARRRRSSPGVADRCAERGVPCFGPTAALARLESSKGYARELADVARHPRAGVRPLRAPATSTRRSAWWRALGRPVVVKLDGLAAGKGVTVPADDAETDAAIRATDGAVRARGADDAARSARCWRSATAASARALPLAQDHKRIGEGDTGPNTGGMGAYAPAPVPYAADELRRDVRPAGARPLRRGRHAVRRRALRRADADRRRPAPRRVQRPLRRPRGPGGAAAARAPTSPRSPSPPPAATSPPSPLDDRRRRRLHRRRRRPRLPRRPGPRRPDSDDTWSR